MRNPSKWKVLVIPAWVFWAEELAELSQNERLIYATILSFSQDEQGAYFGTLNYLGKSLAIKDRSNVRAKIQKLIAKGLIVKNADSIPDKRSYKIYYQAILPPSIDSEMMKKFC